MTGFLIIYPCKFKTRNKSYLRVLNYQNAVFNEKVLVGDDFFELCGILSTDEVVLLPAFGYFYTEQKFYYFESPDSASRITTPNKRPSYRNRAEFDLILL